jgi:amino acid transporter
LATIAGTRLTAVRERDLRHSAELRKELGIRDLLLAQILVVVVPEFFGTAVKAGPAHVFLWLTAFLFFFIPQAFVVEHSNRLMPLEGGLYEWARIAFSDCIGFLVAWNLWLTCTVQVAQTALITTTYITYAAGPKAEWIASNQKILIAISFVSIAGMMLVARLGLRLGKWISNAGSIFTVLIIAVLAALPFALLWRGTLGEYHPARLVLPPLTLFSLSVFAKMTFGALSGFDTVTIFAGESRSPARNIARATLIATPIIALLYITGTSAILTFVSPENVDIIGPIPQALSLGFGSFGAAAAIVAPVAILLLLTNYLCTYVLLFSANARLPMVAGWDSMLPNWFTKLHMRYRTPVNSILFMGGVAIAASMAALLGGGKSGSLCDASDLDLDVLRACVPGHVSNPSGFAERAGLAARLVVAIGCGIRICSDATFCRALCVSDHSSGERDRLHAQNSFRGGRRQRVRACSLFSKSKNSPRGDLS